MNIEWKSVFPQWQQLKCLIVFISIFNVNI